MPPSPSSIDSFSSPGTILSPAPSPYFTNRPPAKSVSTEHSYEFDQRSDPYTMSEPRTPSDHVRERTSYQQSVMTFHDIDPFAAGGIVMTGIGPDTNRLSVWSDNSLLDPHAKRGESTIGNRMSYGSSSSNSHGNPADAQGLQPHLPVVRQRSNAASIRSKRRRREASLAADGGQAAEILAAAQISVGENNKMRTISKSTPASPVTRFDDVGTFGRPPVPAARPAIAAHRPRAATVVDERLPAPSLSHPSNPRTLHRQASESHMSTKSKSTVSTSSPIMFSSARSSFSTNSSGTQAPVHGNRPMVLIRKASQSRVNLPPISSAPPSARLPPPPLSPFLLSEEGGDGDDLDSLSYSDAHVPRSSTSSTMTFASIEFGLEDFEDISVLAREMILDDDLPFTPLATATNMSVEPPPRGVARSKPASPSASNPYLSSPTKVLRKAASQQSMHRRTSQASVASGSSLLSDEAVSPISSNASPIGKAPRKQRSFHHPRIPLPPLPALRHAGHSYNSVTADTTSAKQPIPSNVQPPSQTRRRLFSGSSGRRTSLSKSSSTPPATADDDMRSLSSLSIDGGDSNSRDFGMSAGRIKPIMMSFANMGNQLSLVTDNACIAPAWEELSMGSTTGKRMSHVDYTAQHIMSPAEMLKLEQQFNGKPTSENEVQVEEERGHAAVEQVAMESRTPKLDIDPGDFGLAFIGGGRSKSMRSRTNSLLSDVSAFGPEERKGGGDEVRLRGLVGVAQTFGTPTKRPSTAIGSTKNLGWGASPVRSKVGSPTTARPSTAQASLTSPPTSPISLSPVTDMAGTGLPPPPRPRVSREKSSEVAGNRTSVAPLQPLSPPPRRRPTLKSVTILDDEGASSSSSHTSRPPSAFGQKVSHRRSLARKPSFLDIDDEWDAPNDTVSLADIPIAINTAAHPIDDQECSFLDLDRGASFDTVRSYDDDIGGF
ncbi:hypothetical protein BC835DRAFT_754457 [Cytidiella melzeri]|nr:hypothetical protein BC835DRAFT_754457 [Cytidiella melzeri]